MSSCSVKLPGGDDSVGRRRVPEARWRARARRRGRRCGGLAPEARARASARATWACPRRRAASAKVPDWVRALAGAADARARRPRGRAPAAPGRARSARGAARGRPRRRTRAPPRGARRARCGASAPMIALTSVGHDVPVRVHRDEQRAPLEREADAAARGRRARRRPQAQRLALELEQLLGVDLAAVVLDALEDAPLGGRELRDLLGELAAGCRARPTPSRATARWAASPGGRGSARRWRSSSRTAPARGARAAPAGLRRPTCELDEVRGRQDQLDAASGRAREHEAAREQRLERRRQRTAPRATRAPRPRGG